MSENTKEFTEGFYYLTSEEDPEPVLVHGYECADLGGDFVFGFNAHDGGALLPLSDLKNSTTVSPVEILHKVCREDFNSILSVQCADGNWDYDPYMHGMANGMLVSKSAIYGEEFTPLSAPEQWISDKSEINTLGSGPTASQP